MYGLLFFFFFFLILHPILVIAVNASFRKTACFFKFGRMSKSFCNGVPVGVRAREETGRLRNVKRCVATGNRTGSQEFASRAITARPPRTTRLAPQSFWRVSRVPITIWRGRCCFQSQSASTSVAIVFRRPAEVTALKGFLFLEQTSQEVSTGIFLQKECESIGMSN